MLDEPTTGLHYKDIKSLISLIHRLKLMGHTVILIEHNRQILSTCDYILELGPGGGSDGGGVESSGWLHGTEDNCHKFGVLKNDSSSNMLTVAISPNSKSKIIHIDDVSALYIKHQSVAFPTECLIAVCGVSGSGKSTFINYCLIPYLTDNMKELGIKRVENLGQKNATRTVTSNVGSLLGINDKIARLYSKTSGLNTGNFMINSIEGKCPMCGGKGHIELENGVEEICPNCEGRMFSDEVLQKKYQGLNILEFLQTSVQQLIPLVQEDKKLYKIFSLCDQIGVGYISLARTSKTLSKGEIQRIKLVNVLSNAEKGNVYILDEPSKGLHPFDIRKLINIISEIIKCGNTVIAVEHNLDFIACCSYAIEFGPSSGKDGGRIVFSGDIDRLKKAETSTGIALQSEKVYTDGGVHSDLYAVDDEGNIKIFGDNTIKKNMINYTSVPTKDLDRLFAYTNGEYLNAAIPATSFFVTRQDDDAAQFIGCRLPIIRPVGIGSTTFGRKVRIVDAVGLYDVISRYFLPIAVWDETDERFVPDVFSPGSSVGKCPVCKGAGELEQFDFKLAFSHGIIKPSIEALLKKRTNYIIAKKYLKKDYGLDIFRPFEELSEEEKIVLFFGDRRRKFYDKGKEYYWEGLNRLVIKELRYMDDETLSEIIRTSKNVSPCVACKGELLSRTYRNMSRSVMAYGQFMHCSFIDLLENIQNDKTANQHLVRAVKVIVRLGMGKYNCFTKVSALSKEEQTLLQLAAYFIHPVFDSIIAVDSSVIRFCKSAESVLKDMAQNCTIIINESREV